MTVQPYRFDQAERWPGGSQRLLLAWLEASCMLAVRKWRRLIPFHVEVRPGEAEVLIRKDAMARLPASPVAYCIAVGEGPLNTMFVLPRQLSAALANGLLGEPGGRLSPDRPLTPSEETLCEYLLEQCLLPALQESWPSDKSLRVELRQKEPDPQFTQVLPPSDPLVVIPVVFRGPFGEFICSWLVPRKPLLALLTPTDADEMARASQDPRKDIESHVGTMPVALSVILGRAELPLSQLSRLQVGDVVVLDQCTSDTLTASVAGKQKFRVWCGRIGSRQALQVDSLIES